VSETDELTARVARLEAWVEAAMLLLLGQSGTIENALIALDEARGAYETESE
jgi:hypothetical protein